MENLSIYNAVRSVPQDAQKTLKGGRLSGMTDINPMWRIKMLTETFGPVGFGWYTKVVEQSIHAGAGDERSACVRIHLFVKMNDEWSQPIEGLGGSAFTTKEKNGVYTSDECFKMAFTDAISVACKALGMGADIYWQADSTKYDLQQQVAAQKKQNLTAAVFANEKSAKKLYEFLKTEEVRLGQVLDPVAHLRKYYDFGDEIKDAIYQLYNKQQQ